MNAEELLRQYERVADAPDAVGRLRRFVLELAAAGRLVERRASVGPELPSGGAAGLASRALPTTWALRPLSELLAEVTRNGYSRRPDEPADGTPILRISAATGRPDGVVAEEDHKLISAIEPDMRLQYGLAEGDLLACRFNGNKASVGRFAIFRNKLGLAPIFPDKLIRIRVAKQLVTPEYMRMVGDTSVIRHQVEAMAGVNYLGRPATTILAGGRRGSFGVSC